MGINKFIINIILIAWNVSIVRARKKEGERGEFAVFQYRREFSNIEGRSQ